MDIQSRIDIVPSLMTEQVIIRQTRALGYDPRVNCPRTFRELLADLCGNVMFRQWVSDCLEQAGPGESQLGPYDTSLSGRPGDCVGPLVGSNGAIDIDAIHIIMGERTPVWSRRFHILLSAILSDQW